MRQAEAKRLIAALHEEERKIWEEVERIDWTGIEHYLRKEPS